MLSQISTMKTQPKNRRGGGGVIEEPAQIRLLASPARQDIVDTLEAFGGEATVAAIAAQLGRPSDGLYYHLRLLVRGGLLVELPDDGEGRRYRTLAPRGTRLRLRYRPGKTPNARAVATVAAGMLRTARREFAAGIRHEDVVTEGAARTLWASRAKGWLTGRDLAEANRLLARLNDLFVGGRAPRGGTLVSLTFVLAPVAARPLRRS